MHIAANSINNKPYISSCVERHVNKNKPKAINAAFVPRLGCQRSNLNNREKPTIKSIELKIIVKKNLINPKFIKIN